MGLPAKLLIIIACLLPGLYLTPPASASQLFPVCDKNSRTADSPICNDQNTTTNPVNKRIKAAADTIAVLAGAVAVVMIVISGFTMITSAGNAEAIANSRKRLVAAIVGLLIIALAWTIISFVTDRLIK